MARKDELLTTADLAHNRSQEPSLQEQVENLESSCRVLERSIQLQMSVVNEFPQGSKDYGTAMHIVSSLEDAYGDRKFEAATLRLQATFGNKVQAAQILNNWLDQVEAQVQAQRQPQDIPQDTELPDSGTPVATENGDGSTLEPADAKPTDDEPVH